MGLPLQWFESAQISLQEGQIYTAVREFNSGIFRLLASKSLTPPQELKLRLDEFLKLLGEKKLFHEVDQIFENYLKHYRKLNLSTDYLILLLDLSDSKRQHEVTLIIFKRVLTFCQGNLQQSSFIPVLDVLYSKLKTWKKSLELIPEHYMFVKNLLIMQIRIEILKQIYGDALNSLDYGLTSNIVLGEELMLWIILQAYLLALSGKNDDAINVLQKYRKSKDNKDLNMFFDTGADLILSIHAKDQEWFLESKELVSRLKYITINEPFYSIIMNELLIALQKMYFPDAPKKSLLDNLL